MLRLKKNIVLLGHMGSGKTSLGRSISKLLKLSFIDTDEEIETEMGMSISSLFSEYGEKKFRELEEKIILIILKRQMSSIVSFGGGAFENKTIREMVLRDHISVWLKCDLDILAKRLKKSKKRPLLTKKNIIDELLKLDVQRKKNYEIRRIYNVSMYGIIYNIRIFSILKKKFEKTQKRLFKLYIYY